VAVAAFVLLSCANFQRKHAVRKHSPRCVQRGGGFVSRLSMSTVSAASCSNAVLSFFLYFVFSLAERKNETQDILRSSRANVHPELVEAMS